MSLRTPCAEEVTSVPAWAQAARSRESAGAQVSTGVREPFVVTLSKVQEAEEAGP